MQELLAGPQKSASNTAAVPLSTEQSQELQTFSFFFFLSFSVFLLSVLLTEEQGKRRNLAVGHQSSGLK